MASTIRTSVQRVNELRADLEAIELGLGRELTKVLKEGAGVVLEGAQPLTPYDPLHAATRKDKLPHIRDSLYVIALGSGAAIAAKHPGAVVHEYGGTIAPSGEPITIARAAMAHTAGEASLPTMNALLEQRINSLITRHSG